MKRNEKLTLFKKEICTLILFVYKYFKLRFKIPFQEIFLEIKLFQLNKNVQRSYNKTCLQNSFKFYASLKSYLNKKGYNVLVRMIAIRIKLYNVIRKMYTYRSLFLLISIYVISAYIKYVVLISMWVKFFFFCISIPALLYNLVGLLVSAIIYTVKACILIILIATFIWVHKNHGPVPSLFENIVIFSIIMMFHWLFMDKKSKEEDLRKISEIIQKIKAKIRIFINGAKS